MNMACLDNTSFRPMTDIRSQQGFTLIELLISCAVLAILLTVALPAYQSHIVAGKANTAKADLQALAMALESVKLLTRDYPASAGDTAGVIAAVGSRWRPAQAEFDYQYANHGDGSFTLTAKAKTDSNANGCTLTLDSVKPADNTASEACKTHW